MKRFVEDYCTELSIYQGGIQNRFNTYFPECPIYFSVKSNQFECEYVQETKIKDLLNEHLVK